MKQLNKVVPVEGTIVEKQKLALITEALPQKLPLKIFEASPDDNQVCITSENGEQFIAIDRRYLEKTDFNTLYRGLVLTCSHGTASVSATLSADRLNMLPTTSASARIALNPKRG